LTFLSLLVVVAQAGQKLTLAAATGMAVGVALADTVQA
jgi:hypothetical protein